MMISKSLCVCILERCFIAWMISKAASLHALSGALDEKHILERIKPVGEVTVIGGSLTPVNKVPVISGDPGQLHYEQTCKMCHETGLAGAPKLGDKKDWGPRISQGMEVLIKHAIEGFNAMPPKGGCISCSDDDIKKSVEYMVNKSK